MGTAMDEATFEREVREFFDRNAERRPPAAEHRWGIGPDEVSSIGGDDEAAARRDAQTWRATLFDAGYGWISGPPAYGGAGLDPRFEEIFAAIAAEYDVPDQSLFQVSRGMVSPAVLDHGTDELKERYLPGIHRGEVVCCQLLSEPEAGSDLAGLRTVAVRDGDEWVVNGQKVWSSYAHVASVGQLLARTDPTAPKHQGLTMFMLPMDTPGVEVRPLRQMTGEAHFNEVFFDDVRIPDANRVGAPGGGWRAVLTTLMNERHVVAGGGGSSASPVARLIELAAARGRDHDPVVRQQLAEVYTYDRLLQFLRLRDEAAAAAGKEPGPEGSIGKLIHSANLRRMGSIAGSLIGPGFTADTGDWGTFTWSRFLCSSPGLRIAGGTDEIQRNTLAERALGLPKEPK
ncbi:MAG: acyl-CoA dehydrogenase family protein [Ilumatobacteraceae bacterium]